KPVALNGVDQIDIKDHFNGKLDQFGKSFWSRFQNDCQEISNELRVVPIKSVVYSDRYLLNPAAALLLQAIIIELPFSVSLKSRLSICSMKNDLPRYFENSRPIYKNWYPEEESDRQELLKQLYNENETFASIDVEFESNRNHISHS